jgi:hypothetical protein
MRIYDSKYDKMAIIDRLLKEGREFMVSTFRYYPYCRLNFFREEYKTEDKTKGKSECEEQINLPITNF